MRQAIGVGKSAGQRRGMSTIVALTTLVLISGLASTMLIATRQAQISRGSERDRLQSRLLAESGLARARSRLADDSGYDGETWQVLARDIGLQELAGQSARIVGKVDIRLIVSGQERKRQFQITSDFPLLSPYRARTTIVADVASSRDE